MRSVRPLLLLLSIATLTGRGAAQGTVADSARPKVPARVDTLVATSRKSDLVGIASSANQGTVGAADLALRPLLRPGEVVENIPGVIVTQHSGSGKANQYFLRGFNLDHGTDLAIAVDGVPVNMPTHAHGQGYADLNFLIPELVERVDFRKGPYSANVGDFGSAGAFDVRYYDRLPSGIVRADGGQLGYGRLLIADNIGSGRMMYAAEYEHENGPWTLGNNAQKYDGLLRYRGGNSQRGVTLTASAYHNSWRSTDQVPDRAIGSGLIGRFGTIDATGGGRTGRYSLAAEWHAQRGTASTHVTAYALRYDLDLFSNFTYFLNDPVHGDQLEQQDGRFVTGLKASQSWLGTVGTTVSQLTAGLDARYDRIDNGLYHAQARNRLDATTVNRIHETTAAPYLELRNFWTPWLWSTVGLRADGIWMDVTGTAGSNAGKASATLVSPKLSLVLGPWANTEFYLDAGTGFHSNDARGVVASSNAATALARSKGAEVGARTGWIRGLQSSVSLWLLDLSSELTWAGDAGSNEVSGPTRRYGIELANFYTPNRWLTIDADYAWSHTRFTDDEPEGNYVAEALVSTFDGGIAVHHLGGMLTRWNSGLRFRYFGPRPLTQDNSIRSAATSLMYADLGYRVNDRVRVGLSVFNLLNSRASDIDYFYTSRLQGEPGGGVDDIHRHPAEPRSIRLSVSAMLGAVRPRE